jgi:hypothetical protein
MREISEEGQIGRLSIWAEQVVSYLRELEGRVTRLEAGDTGPDLR